MKKRTRADVRNAAQEGQEIAESNYVKQCPPDVKKILLFVNWQTEALKEKENFHARMDIIEKGIKAAYQLGKKECNFSVN